jgi:diguanylate cyclase (GGDEF)-like protein/PAS domain S-box-containing protein
VRARRYEYIVNTSNDFITLINRDYVYEIANDAYCRTINKARRDILNKTVAEVWGREKFESTIKGFIDRCLAGEEVHYIDKFKFGPFEKHMHVSYYPYRDGEEVTHALVFSHDITRISEIESKLTNYEYRDPVTGLFNRRSLDIILDKEIEKAKRSQSEKARAVLFISLENFAKINQVHGYAVGDLLLENTGLRIKKALRASDFVFRFEGTDLTAVLTGITRITDVAGVAEKIVNDVAVPYRYKNTDIFITCRLGVSVYPEDGEDSDTLIRHAALALEDAKKGPERFVLYNKPLHDRSLTRLSLESKLRQAFEAEQFVLHYQPIVDRKGVIRGAEALIRWDQPGRGLVPPAEFIPLAEETGIIIPLGKWALFSACKQARAWADYQELYISVNLSAREFANENLPDLVDQALKSAGGLDPRRLKLEITETECMENPERAIARMHRLREMGIDIFIDDFGTGHSSLSYLKKLPASILKIDKLFVDECAGKSTEREFLGHIIELIKCKGKKVLAEGVATQAQYRVLLDLGCDRLQGYYFSRPVAAEILARGLAAGRCLPQTSGDT